MPPAPLKDDEIRDVAVFVRAPKDPLFRRRLAGEASRPTPGWLRRVSYDLFSARLTGLSNIGAAVTQTICVGAAEPEADIPESFGEYAGIPYPQQLPRCAATQDGRAITGAR
jgi:hypothetical protein